jgi:Asp/Glu/hydantoin racemase
MGLVHKNWRFVHKPTALSHSECHEPLPTGGTCLATIAGEDRLVCIRRTVQLQGSRMHILLLNPNTSASITDRLTQVARQVVAPDSRVTGLSAPRGVPYISSRAEAQIAGAVLLEMMADHPEPYDAAIVAAFGDPGLAAARELFDVPVVGMAEAAMLTACMLGQRFAIVTFAASLGGWYRDCVAASGLLPRLAGIRFSAEPFSSIDAVASEREDALVALCIAAVEQDGADVVLLAGAPLAGLAARVAPRVPVPVVEQVHAAVLQAEALVRLKVRKATAGSSARPAAKPTLGLSPRLAALIARGDA